MFTHLTLKKLKIKAKIPLLTHTANDQETTQSF